MPDPNSSQRHRRSPARALICALLRYGFAILAAALVSPAPAQPPDRVFRVEAGEVREIEAAQTLEFTGSIEAWRRIEISSLASGKVISLPVEEGDRIKKGDLLLELDRRAEEIALARAQAELAKAAADLRKMQAGFLPQEIKASLKFVEAAQARTRAAREEWDRLKPLAEQKVISETEATRARSALEVAESEEAQAQARLRLLEQGFRSEEVESACAEVQARQAALDDILRRIEDRRVLAPESGVIVNRLKEPGEWASEGESVLEMVMLDPMRLRIEVPQSQVSGISPGQKAELVIDGLGARRITAEVLSVVPQARAETRNFPVLLKVENPDLALAAGMFARTRLEVGEKLKGLAVPREALQYRPMGLVVYRIDELPKDYVFPLGHDPQTTIQNPQARGRPVPPPAIPDAVAREIEISIVQERERDVVIEPKRKGEIQVGTPVVIFGGSRLRDGALLDRLDLVMPGAGQ